MSQKRRNHTAEFKFKIVLEVLKGELTIGQIASKYELIPTQISNWKKDFLENGAEVFSKKKDFEKQDFDKEKARMERKIGELTLSVDFLKKKHDEYFGL